MKFKTKLKVALLGAVSIFLMQSCEKEEDKVIKNTDAVWLTTGSVPSIQTTLSTMGTKPLTKTINALTGGNIAQDGISIIFPGGLFANADGTEYTGNVNVKLTTVTKLADALAYRASCVSDMGDLLISAGMFKIDATDASNNKLKVQAGKSYTADFTATVTPDLKFFNGTDNGEQVTWDWDSTKDGKRGNGTISFFNIKDFNWCNLDKYMNETPLTDIFVNLPAGYTNANSTVILKYTGENSSARIPSNSTLKQFTTSGSYYKIVQNRAAKILVIADKDNKIYYSLVTIASISANQNVNVTSMTEVSQAALDAVIAGL